MIEGYNEATLYDKNKKNNVVCKVNWAPNEVSTIKMSIGDKEAIIPIAELVGLLLSIGTDEQKDSLMPVRKTEMRKYVRQHRIMAKKNIKKGEFIVVNCEIDVPLTVTEGLAGIIGKRKSIIY